MTDNGCDHCGKSLNWERPRGPDAQIAAWYQCSQCGRFSHEVPEPQEEHTIEQTVQPVVRNEVAMKDRAPAPKLYGSDPLEPIKTVIKFWLDKAEDKTPFQAILSSVLEAQKKRGPVE